MNREFETASIFGDHAGSDAARAKQPAQPPAEDTGGANGDATGARTNQPRRLRRSKLADLAHPPPRDNPAQQQPNGVRRRNLRRGKIRDYSAYIRDGPARQHCKTVIAGRHMQLGRAYLRTSEQAGTKMAQRAPPAEPPTEDGVVIGADGTGRNRRLDRAVRS
uniref:Uncharacterized protein n=1 Tax=Oryza brachyantha TaxID=4533 RepID=J3L0K6_ORYBR